MTATATYTFANPNLKEPIVKAEDQLALSLENAIDQLLELTKGVTLQLETTDGQSIYAVPPDQRACEYLLDRILGLPGAQIVLTADPNTTYPVIQPLSQEWYTLSDQEKIRCYFTFLKSESPEPKVSLSRLQTTIHAAEQKIADHLPELLDRMFELANGVTLEKQTASGNRIYTQAPNQRAIKYLLKRILGNPGALLVVEDAKPVDLDVARQEIWHSLTERQMNEAYYANKNRPKPRPELQPGPELQPAKFADIIATAQRKIADFLPNAIARLNELANGITIEKQTPEGPIHINRPPDRHACEYLVNRMLGLPPTALNGYKK